MNEQQTGKSDHSPYDAQRVTTTFTREASSFGDLFNYFMKAIPAAILAGLIWMIIPLVILMIFQIR